MWRCVRRRTLCLDGARSEYPPTKSSGEEVRRQGHTHLHSLPFHTPNAYYEYLGISLVTRHGLPQFLDCLLVHL